MINDQDAEELYDTHIMVRLKDTPKAFFPPCYICDDIISPEDGEKFVMVHVPARIDLCIHNDCFLYWLKALNTFEKTFLSLDTPLAETERGLVN